MATILAIETSCDETAAAVVQGDGAALAVARANVIASQVAIHAEYGGVYPDVAAREHVKNIVPVIELSLREAGLITNHESRIKHRSTMTQKAFGGIDALAVTVGPGLIGSLLVGTNAAAMLADLSGLPIIPINHWEGHLYSVFLKNTTHAEIQTPTPKFPILFLTVSGGHTSLILMRDHFSYEVLGKTIDDAAGEAFDKCARLLGLGYPGGPALSREAALARSSNRESRTANQASLTLPRPMLNSGDLNFSFSGLKTAVRYAIERGEINPNEPASREAAARETEDAIVDVLLKKTAVAVHQYQPTTVAIVGGVSANHELRRRAREELATPDSRFAIRLADRPFTTDNAAMIGAAGLFRLIKYTGVFTSPSDIEANASLRLT